MLLITFSVENRADLRNYFIANRQAVRVFGNTTFNDQTSEIWVFDSSSTLADNGTTVIKPDDVVMPVPGGPGRYIFFEKMKRIETYQGSTIATAGSTQGTFSVTYSKPFSTIPNVQPSFISTDPRESFTLTSSTTTGFTVKLQLRTDVVGLLPAYSNVVNRAVNVLVTEIN